jgi:hypothetical protein
MQLRAVLGWAAWSIAVIACATQQPQTGFVPGTHAIAPCKEGKSLLVNNTSSEAVRLVGRARSESGGPIEIGLLAPGTEGIFSIGGNVRWVWIVRVDLPAGAPGGGVPGIQWECVDSISS